MHDRLWRQDVQDSCIQYVSYQNPTHPAATGDHAYPVIFLVHICYLRVHREGKAGIIIKSLFFSCSAL